MKFKNIYKVTALIALSIVLQSRDNGPGSEQNLQVSGAPGSTGNQGTCANTGCHAGGNFSPVQSMSLFDGANLTDKWVPGKTYKLKIVSTANSGTPSAFGFQAVALNGSNTQAGDWGDLAGTDFHKVTIANRKYAEHSKPLENGVIEVPWVAPAAGAGKVTFYAATLTANGNGASNGDSVAKGMLDIQELVSSTGDLERQQASLRVLPNPVAEKLNLEIVSRNAGDFQIRLADMSGTVVKREAVNIHVGVNRQSLDVADLAPGIYIVELCGDGHLAATRMLKH